MWPDTFNADLHKLNINLHMLVSSSSFPCVVQMRSLYDFWNLRFLLNDQFIGICSLSLKLVLVIPTSIIIRRHTQFVWIPPVVRRHGEFITSLRWFLEQQHQRKKYEITTKGPIGETNEQWANWWNKLVTFQGPGVSIIGTIFDRWERIMMGGIHIPPTGFGDEHVWRLGLSIFDVLWVLLGSCIGRLLDGRWLGGRSARCQPEAIQGIATTWLIFEFNHEISFSPTSWLHPWSLAPFWSVWYNSRPCQLH